MRYVRLGKTELEVSAIAFGTWAFGGDWGSFDAHESGAAIHHALDLGVTFFDTAQAYGFGVSERLLADALWERVRRDEVIVATKGGLRMEGQTLLRDASGRWLRTGCGGEPSQPAHRLHRSVPGPPARPGAAPGGAR